MSNLNKSLKRPTKLSNNFSGSASPPILKKSHSDDVVNQPDMSNQDQLSINEMQLNQNQK